MAFLLTFLVIYSPTGLKILRHFSGFSVKSSLKALKKRLEINQIKFEKESRKIGFDIIPISTDQDFVEPLLSLFKAREKRN